MKCFNIRDYVWNVFEISANQKLDNIKTAFKMFLENIFLGEERYSGTNIDYAELKELWKNESKYHHIMQQLIFYSLISQHFNKLCDAWKKKDKEAFISACNSPLKIMGVIEEDH